MAGFDHSPVQSDEPRDAAVEAYNARLGLVLFTIYLAAYSAYVVVNAFWPAAMDAVPLAGLNLAVLSGLGLIGFALVLALWYAKACRSPRRDA